MKKVAAIDIGTNSVRLLLAHEEDGVLVNKEKHLAMTRIGKDVDQNQCLAEARMQDTIDALVQFKTKLNDFGLTDCPVFATSAVRDAKNREAFVARVAEATGFQIRVISGIQEAELGFKGVLKGATQVLRALEASDKNPEKAPSLFIVIDIGGGSTELILGSYDNQGGQLLIAHSLNIGAVRMTDRHKLKHGATMDDFDVIKGDIAKEIQPFIEKIKGIPSLTHALETNLLASFGIGGTATTLGAIDLEMETYDSQRLQMHHLSRGRVMEITQDLVQMPLEEKLHLKGLMPKRADIIAAGASILLEIMTHFNIDKIYISDDDNLEGAL